MGQKSTCIAGVSWLPIQLHHDERGDLGVFERGMNLPFDIERLFYITNVGVDAVRAEHSVSSAQFLWPVKGSVRVDFDNGGEEQTITLKDVSHGLLIAPGVWLRLSKFTPDAVIMVLASSAYRDTTTYEGPNPTLLQRAADK